MLGCLLGGLLGRPVPVGATPVPVGATPIPVGVAESDLVEVQVRIEGVEGDVEENVRRFLTILRAAEDDGSSDLVPPGLGGEPAVGDDGR